MKYEVILINDSGAVEFSDNYFDNSYTYKTFLVDLKVKKTFSDIKFPLDFKMYANKKFNSLNDFVHSPINFIVNNKAKTILEKHNLPPHVYIPVTISRKALGIVTKNYEYNWFCFDCENTENYYEYIDFQKSEITFYKGKKIVDIKIKTISDLYEIIKNNFSLSDKINSIYRDKNLNDKQKEEKSKEYQTTSWVAEFITLNHNFPRQIDIFNLPLFSWMTFVSEKLKANLITENISDIKFIETEVKSKLPGVKNPRIIIE